MTRTIKLSAAGVTFVVAISFLAYAGMNAAFAASSLLGGASLGLGNVVLVSDTGTPMSGISFDDANGKVFSNLSVLQADFNVTDDNCGAGSPRFKISIDTNNDTVSNGDVLVNLGPSPSFNTCTPNTWTSSGNLIGNNDAGRWNFTALGGPVGGYSSAPASVLNGKILDISIVVDGGTDAGASGGDGEQTVLVDNITITLSSTYDFEPATLVVDDDLAQCPAAAFTTIQSAVNAASAGDTVQVCAGTYPESVSVTKTLTLKGAKFGVDARTRSTSDESIVNGAAGSFTLGANDIILDGFTVQDTTVDLNSGIELSPSFSGYQIRNNIIKNNIFGLYLHSEGTTQTLVSQNLFQTNNNTGASAGNGIYSDQGAVNILIDNNKFTGDEGTAVNLSYTLLPPTASNITISNNEMTGEGAIFALKVTTLDISDNTISTPLNHGMQLEGNSGVTITGNTITGVSDVVNFGWSAIRLSTASGVGANSNVSITGNTMSGSVFALGINVSDGAMSGSPEVHNNAIVGHDTGITNADDDTVNATCNWWGDASGPGTVGPGSGDTVSTNVDFTPWLTTSNLVSGPCDGPLPPPPDVTVTIVKYVDGVHATAANANSTSFPMASSWSNAGFPDGSGTFTLAPSSYEAQTSPMDAGANYSANEELTGPDVGAICSEGKPFALVGYTASTTEANAALETISPTSPALTGITTDKFIIVWNEKCETTLIVKKVVVNDDGGSAATSTFAFKVNGGASQAFEADGQNDIVVVPNTYSVVEDAASGYTTTYSNSLNGNANCDNLVIPSGGTATCTITNNDNAAPPVVLPPSPTACDTPSVAPFGYTLQNGTVGSDNVTIAPFTMFVGLGGYDTVNGPADGNYIVCTGVKTDKITLGNGDFTVSAGDGYNVIVTGNGDGYIEAGVDSDNITTGDGVQTMQVGNGYNKIVTGNGDKNITAGIKSDQITTGSGNDVISAGAGYNNIKSGAGNDNITTGVDNDTIDGGPDTDTCNAGGGFDSIVNCEA